MRKSTKRIISCIHNNYLVVQLDCKQYKLHRIIWYYMTGDWPKECIDHIDGNKTNNAWLNLRDVSIAENCKNLPPHRRGQPFGVTYAKRDKTWLAKGPRNILGIRKQIGCFKTMEEAGNAVQSYVGVTE